MEWTIVTVIISLVGLGAAFIRPIVSLTRSITSLTVVVERVERELADQEKHSTESHRRIWEHNTAQDDRLDDHEMRIDRLERK